MEDNVNKLEKINEHLDKSDNKMSALNDKISKIKYPIKNKTLTSAEKNELQNKIKELESQKKYPEKSEFKESEDDFDESGIHKYTHTKYDFNVFDREGLHKETKDKYNPNGFNINGLHKDTGTFLDKENYIRKDILKNINWLKDKDEFLKLYDEIIKNGECSINTKNGSISSNTFKFFLEDILSGNIRDNEVEDYIEGLNNIEKKIK